MSKRKRKSATQQARAYIRRYGQQASLYARWRADEAVNESTALYWGQVEKEIDQLIRTAKGEQWAAQSLVRQGVARRSPD